MINAYNVHTRDRFGRVQIALSLRTSAVIIQNVWPSRQL